MSADIVKEFHNYLEFLKSKGYGEYKLNKLREYFLEYMSRKSN